MRTYNDHIVLGITEFSDAPRPDSFLAMFLPLLPEVVDAGSKELTRFIPSHLKTDEIVKMQGEYRLALRLLHTYLSNSIVAMTFYHLYRSQFTPDGMRTEATEELIQNANEDLRALSMPQISIPSLLRVMDACMSGDFSPLSGTPVLE